MKKKSFQGIKTIAYYLGPYRGQVYFIGFMAIISSAISASIPYIYGRLVDIAIMGNSSLKLIGMILVLWLCLSLASDWFHRISYFRGYRLAVDAQNDLIARVTNHVLDLPMSFHKNEKIGGIMDKVYRGASYLEDIIGNAIFGICPSFLTVIIALVIMFFVEWHLVVALLVILIFYSFVSIWKIKPIVKQERKLNKAAEQVIGDTYDTVGNIHVVKSCTREELEKKKINKSFHQNLGQKRKDSLDMWRNLNLWHNSTFSLGFAILFTLAILLLRVEMISTGQLVMFVGYVNLSFSPFARLSGYYRQIRKGLPAIERTDDLLKEETEP